MAFTSGKLVSIKRGDNMIQIVGEDCSILSTCSGHCGNLTAIIVEKGQILKKDLLIEKEGENYDKKQEPAPQGEDENGGGDGKGNDGGENPDSKSGTGTEGNGKNGDENREGGEDGK